MSQSDIPSASRAGCQVRLNHVGSGTRTTQSHFTLSTTAARRPGGVQGYFYISAARLMGHASSICSRSPHRTTVDMHIVSTGKAAYPTVGIPLCTQPIIRAGLLADRVLPPLSAMRTLKMNAHNMRCSFADGDPSLSVPLDVS